MDRSEILRIATDEMGGRVTSPQREPGYVLHHGRRVAALCLTLADAVDKPLDVSGEVLFAGGLFHDVAKGSSEHQDAGARRIPQLLADACDAEEISQIAGLVAMHNQRGDERSTTAQRIVQDADVLDHFGAQNIWMAFHYNAVRREPQEETLEWYAGEENRRFMAEARASLNFHVSREAMDGRNAFERDFLERLRQESRGVL